MSTFYSSKASPAVVRKPSDAAGQDAGSKKKKNQLILPVTIRQILLAFQTHATSTEVVIDDQEVAQVTFVGLILQVVEEPNSATYILDDGTGQIQAKSWFMQGKSAYELAAKSKLVENVYVRVFANCTSQGPVKVLSSAVLVPITDFNEITHHYLAAMKQHALALKGGSGGGSAGLVGISELRGSVDSFVQDYMNKKSQNSANGVWINDILRDLPQFARVQIDTALRQLSEAGHIYTVCNNFFLLLM